MCLTGLGVCLMVDGEHHFPRKRCGHHGKLSSDQMVTDLMFDLKVLNGGAPKGVKGVVRLHYLDYGQWALWIALGSALAADTTVQAFAVYSSAYKYNDIVIRC